MATSRNRRDTGTHYHEKSWLKNIKLKLRFLSRAIGHILSGWCTLAPRGKSLRSVKCPQEPRSRNRRVSSLEVGILITNSDLPVLGYLCWFTMATAMRCRELAQLHWRDIDLHASTLRIPQRGSEKSRTIPLSRYAVSILQHQMPRPDGLVWGVTADEINRAFARARQRAGIENLTFHDLRCEAISRMRARGLDDVELAAFIGYRDRRWN